MKTFIILLFSIILASCSAPRATDIRDAGYSKKIESVLLWEQRGLSSQYAMLSDRTMGVQSSLINTLDEKKIPINFTTTTSAGLVLNENNLDILKDKAKLVTHVLSYTVTKATVRIHVDYYTLQFTLYDRPSGKEVWKADVDANWYTKPEDIAMQIIGKLTAAGFI